jgi:hypothetical protein
MRPDNITSEEYKSWETAYQSFVEKLKHDNLIRVPELEIWYAGCWLNRELSILGCPNDIIEKICFAVGQRQALLTGVWEPVYKALEEYKQGRWEVPGPKLAEKIIQEKFGDKPDPLAIFQWFKDQGVPVSKIIEVITSVALGENPGVGNYPK